MVETSDQTSKQLDKLSLNPKEEEKKGGEEDIVTAFMVRANSATGFINYEKLIE